MFTAIEKGKAGKADAPGTLVALWGRAKPSSKEGAGTATPAPGGPAAAQGCPQAPNAAELTPAAAPKAALEGGGEPAAAPPTDVAIRAAPEPSPEPAVAAAVAAQAAPQEQQLEAKPRKVRCRSVWPFGRCKAPLLFCRLLRLDCPPNP